jgi:two-component sensor histidine kinase
VSLAAGLLLGLINASQHYLDHVVSDESYGWGHALAHSVPWWALWGLFTPVIAWMVARYDFSEGSRTRDLAAHAAAAVALTLLHALLYSSFVALVVTPASDLAAFARTVAAFLSKATLNLFTYAGIAGGLFALALYRRLRSRELIAARLQARASVLEARLSQAQLEALEMQLRPHFLFNTLTAISVLVQRGDGDDAARMIGKLSDLLRRTIQRSGKQEVSLAEELGLLEHYLAIQQVRFRDRLRVEYEIEPAVRRARVPHFCLQPIIENAINHGIAADPAAGRVRITARREGDRLVVRVRDDGPGVRASESPSAGVGVGLANTRARLRQLYGVEHRLEIANVPEGGAEAVLDLPFRDIGEESTSEHEERRSVPR